MRKGPSASDLADKFMLRLPDGMRERIAAEAKRNGRSMNGEIVARLQQSLEGGTPDAGREEIAKIVNDAFAESMRRLVELTNKVSADELVKRVKEEFKERSREYDESLQQEKKKAAR